jgi:hypothetical protein
MKKKGHHITFFNNEEDKSTVTPQKWIDINTFHNFSLVNLEERLGLKGDSHMAPKD